MITLGANQALEGFSTDANEVTFTITGATITPGTPPTAANYEVLAQGQMPASAAAIYNPGAGNYALISSIHLFSNNLASAEVVSLFVEGTASANAIATLTIPPAGFATYEDGHSWQVYTAGGISGAPLVTSSTYIGSNIVLGATTDTTITQLQLAAGTWLIYGTVYARAATATLGHMDIWLGSQSASHAGTYVASTLSLGDIAGGTEDQFGTLVTVQTSPTVFTVFLDCYATEAWTIEFSSFERSLPNCTGILAVKIG